MREQDPLGGLEEIEKSTSIDLLNDVDSLTLAMGPPAKEREPWGVVLQGVFDRERLLAKLAGGKGDVQTSTHSGTEIHSIGNGRQSMALAQPDDSILLFGDFAYVLEMLDAGAGRKPSQTAIPSRWGYEGFEEETFWFAGAPRFLDGLVGRNKDAAALRSFAITGRFESDLVLRARGEAVDAAKARELADVVRGLVAFGRLQQDHAELGKILETVSVELTEQQIDVNLQVPYESIRELMNRKARAESAH
jgi:hypothetical protein